MKKRSPMKKLFVILVFFVFWINCIITDAAYAEANKKIGYIDIPKVFDEYNKTKASDKLLEKASSQKQQERDKMVNDIKRMEDELELLSESAKKKKQDTIEEKIKGLREFDKRARDDLKKERDAMARDILKEIEETVTEYGKANGYTLILNDGAILYGEDNMDVTNEIIKILNNKYKPNR